MGIEKLRALQVDTVDRVRVACAYIFTVRSEYIRKSASRYTVRR